MTLLQIYHWVCQWKNFENQSTFGEVTDKSIVACFFDSQCIYQQGRKQHISGINVGILHTCSSAKHNETLPLTRLQADFSSAQEPSGRLCFQQSNEHSQWQNTIKVLLWKQSKLSQLLLKAPFLYMNCFPHHNSTALDPRTVRDANMAAIVSIPDSSS